MGKQPALPLDQALAIPYRVQSGRLEFCLITTSRKRRWGLPKGVVESGETRRQTALKEAQEEAGLSGKIVGRAVGAYQYRKWGLQLAVTAYLLQVEEESDDYPERRLRARAWLPAKKALRRIGCEYQRELLFKASTLLAG